MLGDVWCVGCWMRTRHRWGYCKQLQELRRACRSGRCGRRDWDGEAATELMSLGAAFWVSLSVAVPDREWLEWFWCKLQAKNEWSHLGGSCKFLIRHSLLLDARSDIDFINIFLPTNWWGHPAGLLIFQPKGRLFKSQSFSYSFKEEKVCSPTLLVQLWLEVWDSTCCPPASLGCWRRSSLSSKCLPCEQAPAGSRDWTQIPIPRFLKIKFRDFVKFRPGVKFLRTLVPSLWVDLKTRLHILCQGAVAHHEHWTPW